MRKRPTSKPTPSQADPLSGLTPGMRMKGGVRYDPAVHGFVAIIHSWDNVACLGEPQEWRTPQVFPTEDAAMQYYKTNLRPALEQITAEMAKTSTKVIRRRLEE